MEAFSEYIKVEDAAGKWNLSTRRVQILCSQGKIKGAVRFGREWMIPKDAQKPRDGRTKAGRLSEAESLSINMPMPRKTPFLHMTDLYSEPGSAKASIEALKDNPEAQLLLASEIAYSRGEIDKVYENASFLLKRNSGFYSVISAGMLLGLCAIWRGDLNLWRQAKIHIAEAPAKNNSDRDIMSFSITAIDSILYNVTDFPEWFTMGRFDALPADSLPAAKVFYAKFLYAIAYAVATKEFEHHDVSGLSLFTMIPYTLEPMISQAVADRSVIAEIYLRMTCAVIYYSGGNEQQAIYHVDRAINLAIPDELYGLLAEYVRTAGPLLEARLNRVDPFIWDKVNSLHHVHNEGWSRLSGSVRGRTIVTTLSQKQREVAKLAAFGLKNEEIAKTLNMSVSAVKQAITTVSNKTGMTRKEFAAIL